MMMMDGIATAALKNMILFKGETSSVAIEDSTIA